MVATPPGGVTRVDHESAQLSRLEVASPKSLHRGSVCLHQWRVPQFALKYTCNPPPPHGGGPSLGDPPPPGHSSAKTEEGGGGGCHAIRGAGASGPLSCGGVWPGVCVARGVGQSRAADPLQLWGWGRGPRRRGQREGPLHERGPGTRCGPTASLCSTSRFDQRRCGPSLQDQGPRMHQKGKVPQRRPQRRLGRRLEEGAKAVGGRLLSVALGVRGGQWLGIGWAPWRPSNASLPGPGHSCSPQAELMTHCIGGGRGGSHPCQALCLTFF